MPSPIQMRLGLAALEPWKLLTRPVYYGIDRIPEERPMLFVGNHTLYGLLDAPLMGAELYEKRGIWLRGLGDFAHFQIPGWSQLLTHLGVVPGTREICAKLMKQKAAICVFPGGARETVRLHGESTTWTGATAWASRKWRSRTAARSSRSAPSAPMTRSPSGSTAPS
jgi:1-acyl-sn-glycerol-3-phosphate acyltransferase